MDQKKKDEIKVLLIATPIMTAITLAFSFLNTSSEALRSIATLISCGAVYFLTYKVVTARNFSKNS